MKKLSVTVLRRQVGKIAALTMGAALLLGLASCSGGDSDSSGGGDGGAEVSPGTVEEIPATLKSAASLAKTLDVSGDKVILFYYRSDASYSKWGLWLWGDGAEADRGDFTATSGKFTVDPSSKIAYQILSDNASLSSAIQAVISDKQNLNFIIRDAEWVKDPGSDQSFDLSQGEHFMILSGDSAVYPISDTMLPSISGVNAESKTELKVSLSVRLGLDTSAGANGFVLKSDGGEIAVSDVKNYEYKDSADRSHNYASTLYLKLAGELDLAKKWYLSREGFTPLAGCEVMTANVMKTSLGELDYTGGDLGLTLNNDGTATFKVWAPLADDVQLLLFKSAAALETPAETKPMTLDDKTGVWSAANVSFVSHTYYTARRTMCATSTRSRRAATAWRRRLLTSTKPRARSPPA